MCAALCARLAATAQEQGTRGEPPAMGDADVRRVSEAVLRALRHTTLAVRLLENGCEGGDGGPETAPEDVDDLLDSLEHELAQLGSAAQHLLKASPLFSGLCAEDRWLQGLLAAEGGLHLGGGPAAVPASLLPLLDALSAV